MKRAVIVGHENPASSDPADALEPYTPRGSGERLWKMLSSVVPVSKEQYCDTFDLVNVRVDRQWRHEAVREMVGTRPAAVLGISAWRVLRLQSEPVVRVDWFDHLDNWWLMPHPSGLCRVYNGQEMRRRAGELLAELGGLR